MTSTPNGKPADNGSLTGSSSLRCPNCNSERGKCLETREIRFRGIFFVMRIRLCDHCGYQFRTKETTDDDIVIKRQPAIEQEFDEELTKAEEAKQEIQASSPAALTPEDESTLASPIPQAENDKLITAANNKRKYKKRGRPRKGGIESYEEPAIEEPSIEDEYEEHLASETHTETHDSVQPEPSPVDPADLPPSFPESVFPRV